MFPGFGGVSGVSRKGLNSFLISQPQVSKAEEAMIELRKILHEKLQFGVNHRVLKKWSSFGLPVDTSNFNVFRSLDGAQNVVLIPQLENVVINDAQVFQDYKPFYQRETFKTQLKSVLKKAVPKVEDVLRRIVVQVRVRWSTFENQNVPVSYTVFRMTQKGSEDAKFFLIN